MKVYLIEDTFIIRKTLKHFLEDLGHEVMTFYSIIEVLSLQTLENKEVDVIIIDLELPQEQCIKELKMIHTKYPATPIILMSPILPYKDAIACGIYSYLKRPIMFAELELMLTRISEKGNTIAIQSFNNTISP